MPRGRTKPNPPRSRGRGKPPHDQACADAQASWRLDHALADTGPASDPPALLAPRSKSAPLVCAPQACGGTSADLSLGEA